MKDFTRVGVGESLYMGDTNLDFRATTVDYRGVTGFGLGRARHGHIVDGFKCFAAKFLADAVGGLEDAPMMSEMWIHQFPNSQKWGGETRLILVTTPGGLEGGLVCVLSDVVAILRRWGENWEP